MSDSNERAALYARVSSEQQAEAGTIASQMEALRQRVVADGRVLAWRLSNTLDTCFCLEALADALEGCGIPEIFNTDQGSQFTSVAFTGMLEASGIRCSMDGRGRCLDNVFIERLWRSLKYEAVYLRELKDGFEAQRVIAQWLEFYNEERPHSALDGRTPGEVYRAGGVVSQGKSLAAQAFCSD